MRESRAKRTQELLTKTARPVRVTRKNSPVPRNEEYVLTGKCGTKLRADDKCIAVFSGDGLEYEAVVVKVNKTGSAATVRYIADELVKQVKAHQIRRHVPEEIPTLKQIANKFYDIEDSDKSLESLHTEFIDVHNKSKEATTATSKRQTRRSSRLSDVKIEAVNNADRSNSSSATLQAEVGSVDSNRGHKIKNTHSTPFVGRFPSNVDDFQFTAVPAQANILQAMQEINASSPAPDVPSSSPNYAEQEAFSSASPGGTGAHQNTLDLLKSSKRRLSAHFHQQPNDETLELLRMKRNNLKTTVVPPTPLSPDITTPLACSLTAATLKSPQSATPSSVSVAPNAQNRSNCTDAYRTPEASHADDNNNYENAVHDQTSVPYEKYQQLEQENARLRRRLNNIAYCMENSFSLEGANDY